jgi:hypothetical protein
MQPKSENLRKLAAAVIAGVAVIACGLLLPRAAAFLGISHWSMYACALAAFLFAITLTRWRHLYPPNRPGLVLTTGGVFALAVCSVINEHVVHFFTPGRIYLVASLLPAIAWEAFRYVKTMRKDESRTDSPGQ